MIRIILTILSVVILTSVVEITLFEIPNQESLNEMLDFSLDLAKQYVVVILILTLLFQLFRNKNKSKIGLTRYVLHAIFLTLIAFVLIPMWIVNLGEEEKISFKYITDLLLDSPGIVVAFLSHSPDIAIAGILMGFFIPLMDHFFSKQTVKTDLEETNEYKTQSISIGKIPKLLVRNCLKLFFAGMAWLLVYVASIVAIFIFLKLIDFENLHAYAVYLIIILFLYFALLMASLTMRILVRMFPLRANGQWRQGVIISFILLIGAISIYFIFLMTHPLELVPVISEATIALPILLIIFFIVYIGIVIIYPMMWLVIIHARCKMRKGILYLRKFNGKGDTAIMAAILRKAPEKIPITFIASPGWNAGTWDPIVLIFAGFKWYMPWLNIPLFLKTKDNTWQSDVKYWISSSRAVVIDISDLSLSVTMETAFINEKNARHKTLALKNQKNEEPHPKNMTNTFETIPYSLSWGNAFPRILFGFIFILILATTITSLIQVGANFIDIKVLILVFAFLLPMLLLFLRPSLSKSSEQSIKIALRRILNISI